MTQKKHSLERDRSKFIGKDDVVQHTAGWTGKVIKVLGDGAFAVRTTDGDYYACHDLNLTVIKEAG